MNKGLAHHMSVEAVISPDTLSTPLQWRMTADFAATDGSARPWPRIEHQMRVDGRKLELSAGKSKRSIPRPPAYTSAWCLLDAVQRMPRQPREPLRFTFFDRNNAAKAGHVLRYREAVELAFGSTPGAPVRLHGFEHLGDGFVPSVYWTDDTGRLVMFNHSLQGYILQPARAQGAA